MSVDVDESVCGAVSDLAQWNSRASVYSTPERVDPYWHGLWVDGSQTSWLSRPLAERRARDGVATAVRYDVTHTVAAARQMVLRDQRRPRLRAWASLLCWRTMTAQQIGAMIGHERVAMERSTMRALFSADIVERGSFASEMRWRGGDVPLQLFRPTASGSVDELLASVSADEQYAITAGMAVQRGSQYDRHNVLSTEAGLRVAEYGRGVAMVFGEGLSRMDLLTRDAVADDKRSADVSVFRSDGMRVALEVTASTGADFAKKVQRWKDALVEQPNLCVIFVDASGPDRPAGVRAETWRTLRKAVIAAAHGDMGAVLAGVAQRMMVARWTDWFPAAWRASEGFAVLRSWRPVGSPDDRWRSVDVLDAEHVPVTGSASTHVVGNARRLWGVPHWLRDAGPVPCFRDDLVRAHGFTQGYPGIGWG